MYKNVKTISKELLYLMKFYITTFKNKTLNIFDIKIFEFEF